MKKRRTLLLCILATLAHLTSLAQSDNKIWAPIQSYELGSKEALTQKGMPHQFQAYRITNPEELERIFQSAPMRFSAEAAQSNIEITLPLPDGRMESFRIFNFPVMQPRLASAYPELRTFTAAGVRNPNATAKIEMTPKGFFAMILGYDQGTIFINPFSVTDNTYYAFCKKDSKNIGRDFTCQVEELKDDSQIAGMGNKPTSGDCQLRQYRLALACTGEFAQFHDDGIDLNGGIITDALASMVITMNRVNGIFEKEVGITMVIIDNNTDIMFTDPDTDPYTNSSTNEMLSENLRTCDNIIGPANYDIGHVFGYGGGGRAFLRSPCNFNKGRGVSKSRDQIGDSDAFIDLVAHEMGHQYGATHTQNNSFCFPSFSTPYEPGSGSTIMSYGGICPPNVQAYSDLYFHAISIEQMGDFVTTSGNSCPVFLSSANNAPSAEAGNSYTIPISTPFVLTGNGTDPDDDPITYCWEQWDNAEAPVPPLSTSEIGPNFRSFLPTTDPQRYFPRISVLLGLEDNTWEVLPSVSRDLNFRLTVRNNNNAYGCTDASNMTVTVDDAAGPFTITYPNASEEWRIGDSEMITWDVANTDAAPVNCANVDILYSTDGGFTYPNVIAENVPNNGSYLMTVPEAASSKVRFMVRCSDNIFFDISDADIAIGIQPVCAEINSDDAPLTITSAGTPTITSELNVGFDKTITDIKVVNLTGTHSYIGDLRFKLISSSGVECILIDQRCAASTDFDLGLDDFGNTLSCPYNDGQIARPMESLSIFEGTNSSGNWILEVSDLSGFDGGELLSWGLEICYEEALATAINELRDQVSMELSPNPVRQDLNVSLFFNDPFSGYLQVVNTHGETLVQVDVESERSYQHQLLLGHLAAGVYFLRVVSHEGSQMVEKFIKQ